MTYVLDASAILRFTDKEAGFERVRDLLMQATKGTVELLLSAVNWGEIAGALYKRSGALQSKAGPLTASLAALPITIVAVDRECAESAATFQCSFKVPYADAFAGSLALRENATLVTADFDFKNVPAGTMKIEFLSGK
jgi:PIN domain nuclease of toxin-antitoxin system